MPLQSAWAAWRFTGDDKYLRPILGRAAQRGPDLLGRLNEDGVMLTGHADEWGKGYRRAPTRAEIRSRNMRPGTTTGDSKYLDALHADAIEDKIATHVHVHGRAIGGPTASISPTTSCNASGLVAWPSAQPDLSRAIL